MIMKKFLFVSAIAAMFAISCDKYDDTEIRGLISDQDARIEKLEQAIDSQKKAIEELQKAIDQMDYVTGITPIKTGDVTTSIIVSFKTAPSITIQLSGQTQEDLIKDVRTENGYAIFVLSDNTTIQIPMATKPVLTITASDVVCLPGKTASFQYSVSGGDVDNQVEAIADNGWSAEVVPANAEGGVVNVTAPASGKGKVLVIVNSGAGLCAMKSISCTEGRFTVSDKAVSVPAEGGEFSITVGSNLDSDYIVTIADSWISQKTGTATKAEYKEDELCFNVAANEGKTERSSTITISASDVTYTVTVKQDCSMNYIWKPCTSAADLVEGECILAFAISSNIYLLPITANSHKTTKVNPNPSAPDITTVYSFDDQGNITTTDPTDVFNAVKKEDVWNFHYLTSKGADVYLWGLGTAQGVFINQDSVAATITVDKSKDWVVADFETDGLQFQPSGITTRYLGVLADATLGDTWRMNTATTVGHMVVYQKTFAE